MHAQSSFKQNSLFIILETIFFSIMVEDTVQEQSVPKQVEFLIESFDSGKNVDIEQPMKEEFQSSDMEDDASVEQPSSIAKDRPRSGSGSNCLDLSQSSLPELVRSTCTKGDGPKLRKVVSDVSVEIKRIGKDWEAMGNIDEVEEAECECCGLNEECTQEYIRKTKDCYSGKWVCGLCSEAVKETLVREPRRSIEEALRNQREFCQEFHSSRLNPELSLTCAMRKIAKTSCEHRKYNNTSSTLKITRSNSCFPDIDLRMM